MEQYGIGLAPWRVPPPDPRILTASRAEELRDDSGRLLAAVATLLGLSAPIAGDSIRPGRSDAYAERWQAMATGDPLRRRIRRRIVARYADDMLAYGYDPETLAADPEWRPPTTH